MVERQYRAAAVERAMKVQEVIMRAMGKQITWWQAAEILGVTPRTIRRMKCNWKRAGFDGLYNHRHHRPSPKRVPVKDAGEGLELFPDPNVHEIRKVVRRNELPCFSGIVLLEASQLYRPSPVCRAQRVANPALGIRHPRFSCILLDQFVLRSIWACGTAGKQIIKASRPTLASEFSGSYGSLLETLTIQIEYAHVRMHRSCSNANIPT